MPGEKDFLPTKYRVRCGRDVHEIERGGPGVSVGGRRIEWAVADVKPKVDGVVMGKDVKGVKFEEVPGWIPFVQVADKTGEKWYRAPHWRQDGEAGFLEEVSSHRLVLIPNAVYNDDADLLAKQIAPIVPWLTHSAIRSAIIEAGYDLNLASSRLLDKRSPSPPSPSTPSTTQPTSLCPICNAPMPQDDPCSICGVPPTAPPSTIAVLGTIKTEVAKYAAANPKLTKQQVLQSAKDALSKQATLLRTFSLCIRVGERCTPKVTFIPQRLESSITLLENGFELGNDRRFHLFLTPSLGNAICLRRKIYTEDVTIFCECRSHSRPAHNAISYLDTDLRSRLQLSLKQTLIFLFSLAHCLNGSSVGEEEGARWVEQFERKNDT
eukprot:TRINITY_DN43663_c0_g1_i1.p1 TRINITY_DN43663_c0_g1~~TRINITY_DN43663_c0_g1_i1.p1  ORF type:complete len:394 (+),score=41.26 TRINITY_DN43663_c0_g1_i1:45-1184(+)